MTQLADNYIQLCIYWSAFAKFTRIKGTSENQCVGQQLTYHHDNGASSD